MLLIFIKKFLEKKAENGVYDLGTGHGYLIKDIIDFSDFAKSKIVKIDNISEIHNSVAHNSKID